MAATDKGPGMSLIIGLAKKKVKDSLPPTVSAEDWEEVAKDILSAIEGGDAKALAEALLAFRDVTADDE